MPNHPDFVPFTDADIASLERAAEAAGCSCACATDSPFDCGPECAKLTASLEPVMERTLSNLAVTAETGSCPVLVRAVGCECGGECETCTRDEEAGAELMDRLRAEEGGL